MFESLSRLFGELSLDGAKREKEVDAKETQTESKVQDRALLVGFADTEGAPHRSESSNLWDFAVVFDSVIDEATSKVRVKLEHPHIFNISIPRSYKGGNKQGTFAHVRNSIEHICLIAKMHDAQAIGLPFWSEPHDVAVLKHYFRKADLPFYTQDLLKPVRDSKAFDFPTYDLDTVHGLATAASPSPSSPSPGQRAGGATLRACELRRHSALGDAMRLREIHESLQLRFPPFLETGSQNKAQ